MNSLVKMFVGTMVIALVVSVPMRAWAQQEHGGKEHGGQPAPAAGQEQGGKEHGGAAVSEGEMATVHEAVEALEGINPGLAAELEDWAHGEGTGDKTALVTQAADALEGSDPDLARRVRNLIEG